ncbi:MAG: hypothetical protein HOK42_08235 [Candidatus Marinimicrobia bacterium]|jgi:hypothetical protein|nr:hypothetical protein [Candidatus Neomarinimicrobiota bacterium]
MKSLSIVFRRFNRLLIASLTSLSILSCGGETAAIAGISGTGATTAGISGTGVVFGVITGFGSIFVNGIEYETDNASFDVDGNIVTDQTSLRVGMVVTLSTTEFDDGTFEANAVVYDDSIEGPILSDPVIPQSGNSDQREFTVMGIRVVVDASTTSFHNVRFETLALNDVIEVSGFVSADNTITATLVEKKDELDPVSNPTVEVEMHGLIEQLDSTGTFQLNGVTVNYDASGITTEFDDLPNGLADGLSVEVKGVFDPKTTSIQANEIEGEDDDVIGSNNSGSGGATDPSAPPTSVSVQGLIAGFTDVASTFTINGLTVQVDTTQVLASITDQLENGLLIEVEGVFNDSNILLADEVEIRAGKSKYQARVKSLDVTARTLSIEYPNISGDIVLLIDNQSTLEDEDHNPLTLQDFVIGDDVSVVVRLIENDRFVVSLQRERGLQISYEISGLVESHIADVSITIDGLVFPLNAASVIYDPLLGSPPVIQDGVTSLELEDDDRDGLVDEVSPFTPG